MNVLDEVFAEVLDKERQCETYIVFEALCGSQSACIAE